ncbi:alpha/beta hydrolase [Paeniroseomonas aquatica]|uniref:Alpha/beta hydrolase n=2 Tax=Paeniroseomonas aquatica TaxID=373043 RepID=A0ABT8AAU9_9PROT|nr:alpha/beta hydrolase [Paeniroseomonas aquatica]MDN3566854.1 alpha/beta hydrolase [Paeniroseomonas aquatica]
MMLPWSRRAFAGSLLGLAACQSPIARMPDPTGLAAGDMAELLQAYAALGPKPLESLTPAEARRQPSMADAVKAVQRRRGMDLAPRPVAMVQDIQVQGAAGPLPARIYGERRANGAAPMILYFHGGGWVIADLDTYDASARALAAETGAIVVSVHYRQGPEHRFPAAHEDAVAAYQWLVANSRTLGGDPNRIAVAGESAGGNLALTVGMALRASPAGRPAHLLLIYPVADTDVNAPSMRDQENAKPLSRAAVLWFVQNYTRGPSDLQDPRLDVGRAADLAGLPRCTVVIAGIDPLRSGGERLVGKLRAAGVQTDARSFPGATHEFFGAAPVLQDAVVAQSYAGARLREVFAGRA